MSMIKNLATTHSIANRIVAQLRDVNVQQDRMRFRHNLKQLGQIMAYEISKTLQYTDKDIETPLGIATIALPTDRIVLATILRAGMPLHEGLLEVFDDADSAFISAYRKHHRDGTFEILLEYLACPNLEGCTLIIADPMLATGASLQGTIQALAPYGKPAHIHIVTAIASRAGLDYLRRLQPKASIWMAALDEELTAKSYIVPGLGDAGDLSYGEKLQH